MSESHEALRLEIVALLPRLRRFARTITRHREDADDLVQLAVERALLRLDQWQPGTRLDSWMFMIMKNAWIDEVRSRGRRDAIFLPAEAGQNAGDSPTERHRHRPAGPKAMARWSEAQRPAVAPGLAEGLPRRHAAAGLALP